MKKLLLSLLLVAGMAEAAFKTDQLTVTGLIPGGCVQADSNGLLQTTGSACGSGGGSSYTATLADANSATIEIGAAGVWKAVGALSFTATYQNGTPIGSTVTFTGWGASLPLTNSWAGPTLNTEAVNYPAVAGTVTFNLASQSSSASDTDALVHTFVNRRFWGVSTVSGSYTEADVEGLAGTELSNSVVKTFSVSPGSGQYIVWSSPSRLGPIEFFVGGFPGGFLGPETVSITNASGYTENYYVYHSVNSNLGSTSVTTAAQ